MTELRQRGFCTLCRSRCGAIFVTQAGRLTAGVVSHMREIDEDICLTCCAVPIGDITLEA